ncbi:hypothetical protein NPIL_349001 [Nephila pilipes]|uniref:Uncharacterized protein n=1 Tax=Nephila pilipes TaxID=299642 RepID=A0A8X6NIX3_NEPPI|nr:hypothetical protein NPIL_349001 [Nephila pilipes]
MYHLTSSSNSLNGYKSSCNLKYGNKTKTRSKSFAPIFIRFSCEELFESKSLKMKAFVFKIIEIDCGRPQKSFPFPISKFTLGFHSIFRRRHLLLQDIIEATALIHGFYSNPMFLVDTIQASCGDTLDFDFAQFHMREILSSSC